MSFFTGSSSSRPRRQPSEPTYETPTYDQQPQVRRYAQNQQSKFGNHFQKGSVQEEIYDRRADGENIPAGHPDLRDRAHSFHEPIQPHKYSDPFKKIPQQWSGQMRAERSNYHALCDRKKDKDSEAIRLASDLGMGRKHKARPEQGTIIKAGISGCEAWAAHSNRAGQARDGFAHKYPQSYEDLGATATHHNEVTKSRERAKGFRLKATVLAGKHTRWAEKMAGK
ncbi:hypothetical protein EN45_084430 [Penicillium chrysogenum]|uniref:Pc21g22940 protein n=2 Tax=Penicillium chrysogenum species complex TaxID=254878 RepID=B6HHU6_PENRW|nr:hypothetical protein EN45_084430 [Penicillium chrysogenum]CAP97191.1 Pc21g22940 [Penicillium rubens Wisconsin 54-1255]